MAKLSIVTTMECSQPWSEKSSEYGERTRRMEEKKLKATGTQHLLVKAQYACIDLYLCRCPARCTLARSNFLQSFTIHFFILRSRGGVYENRVLW